MLLLLHVCVCVCVCVCVVKNIYRMYINSHLNRKRVYVGNLEEEMECENKGVKKRELKKLEHVQDA